MIHRKRLYFIVLAETCLFASLLHARVFSAQSMDLFKPASYGRLIYKTIMEINEGTAEVSVMACDENLISALTALSARCESTLRLLALSFGSEKPALLVTVVQSKSDQEASKTKRPLHHLHDVPVPSDGVVLGTMKSGDTRTTFERIEAHLEKNEVIQFFEWGMARNGWTKMVSTADGSSFLFYSKGHDICLILVTTQESNGETGITLLHKQGAVN